MDIQDKVKHVVVLMLENRSFDNLCGYLSVSNPRIDGLLGEEFNLRNPSDAGSEKIEVSDTAPFVPDLNPGPGHDVRDVKVQISPGGDLNMGGFVYDYAQQPGITSADAVRVMQCYSPTKLPVITTLSRQFVLCDRWHSSLPGPTWPNRLFVHCATSGGYTDNNPHNFSMRTIFENLSDLQLDSWRIYFHDTPQTAMLANLRNERYLRFFEQFDAFKRDCAQNCLPRYSFIEPRYFSVLGNAANDQHPDHGVWLGERLIADVYNALRASEAWNESLLVVTWDEHGGFYDHRVPDKTVNPDGKVSPECDFTLLGVRVPALIVSPWVEPNVVDKTLYDHTSIPATLKKMFGTADFLTERDRRANTFEKSLCLNTPRRDSPTDLAPASTSIAETFHAGVQGALSQVRPPTDLQRSLISLANEVSPSHARNPSSVITELEAAQHVHQATARLLASAE